MVISSPRNTGRATKATPARDKFAKVRVLLADRDIRTATLVQRVLLSFGFSNIDIAHNGKAALDKLAEHKFDLLITEWAMAPVSGIEMVKAIRRAKAEKRIKRDIPIIMLTAQGQKETVIDARDAGISEFLVKPFSAQTISDRLIQVIDNPRAFVDSDSFVGPCRRRKGSPPPGMQERRGQKKADILPPNRDIRETIGVDASEILTEIEVKRAQLELQKAESDFIAWAKDDISSLENTYKQLAANPSHPQAKRQMLEAAYAIKSQAGIFGYDLGTQIAGMLVDYLNAHGDIDSNRLTVIRKHIDVISVVFRNQIKNAAQNVGRELIASLHKLVEKLG